MKYKTQNTYEFCSFDLDADRQFYASQDKANCSKTTVFPFRACILSILTLLSPSIPEVHYREKQIRLI